MRVGAVCAASFASFGREALSRPRIAETVPIAPETAGTLTNRVDAALRTAWLTRRGGPRHCLDAEPSRRANLRQLARPVRQFVLVARQAIPPARKLERLTRHFAHPRRPPARPWSQTAPTRCDLPSTDRQFAHPIGQFVRPCR